MNLSNEAGWDRTIRVAGGVVLLIVALTVVEGTVRLVAMGAGAVLLLTGFVGWCPAYSVFGFRTLRNRRA